MTSIPKESGDYEIKESKPPLTSYGLLMLISLPKFKEVDLNEQERELCDSLYKKYLFRQQILSMIPALIGCRLFSIAYWRYSYSKKKSFFLSFVGFSLLNTLTFPIANLMIKIGNRSQVQEALRNEKVLNFYKKMLPNK
jgi:hypothetical protein